MKYYFLIYTSVATRTLEGAEITDLVSRARISNKARGITGILLLLDDMYIQLIEGSKSGIDQLFMKIKLDVRHEHIVTLQEGYTDKRRFEDWSMGFNRVRFSLEEIAGVVDLDAPQCKKLLSIIDEF